MSAKQRPGVRMGLGIKVFLLIIIYTIAGLAFLSMLLYSYIREHHIRYLVSMVNARVSEWENHVKHELNYKGDPMRVVGNLPGRKKETGRSFDISEKEHIGLFNEDGSRISILKGDVPQNISNILKHSPKLYAGIMTKIFIRFINRKILKGGGCALRTGRAKYRSFL